MANEKLEPIKQIEQHILKKENFVLSGGAGSGKTRTLIEVLDLLYSINPKYKIACITFTNVAADEIKNRVVGKNLNLKASTIHDFLWEVIKNYQKNLKQILVSLIELKKISYGGEELLNFDWYKARNIEYREWRKLEEGIISHNEVLLLANALFNKFPLLRNIVRDKYNFILIDEYQDTERQVIEIFLNYIQEQEKPPIIGLFGDSMQSIYDKGVGDLNEYIDNGIIKEVQKADNWRCSGSVISLINQIRNDGLIQKAAGENLNGNIKFLYSNKENIEIEKLKNNKVFDLFNFNDPKENKELYLTHNLIAKQFGFANLLNSYEYKDNLIGDSPDRLAKHLFNIQEIIYLYNIKKYNEFIKKTDLKIHKVSDKQILKEKIDNLSNSLEKTIVEVINLADSLGLVIIDDKLNNYISEHAKQFEKIKELPYKEVVHLFDYRNEYSPYSTQHGVKGAEFNNIFIILDNGRWNQYNFKYLFEENGNDNVIKRTRKIFYVCCSRSRENLIVFYHKPSQQVVDKAKQWFGEKNTIEIE